MPLTIKQLANLLADGNFEAMLSAVKGKLPLEEPGQVAAPGIDKGFPVSGECNIPTYPVYLVPVHAKNDTGFRVNYFDRIMDKVVEHLPGSDIADASVYYTPAADLMSWQTIKKENLPPRVRQRSVIGDFESYVDTTFPNGDKHVQLNAYILLADLLLRIDTRGKVRERAIAAGCRYIEAKNTNPSDLPKIAVLTRAEAVVEYDFGQKKWDYVEDLPEPSVLQNATQHKQFVPMAQPGRVTMSGKDVADLALATADGLRMLAKVYEDNLETYLSTSRFKIRHPIDTVGFFLRYCASGAIRYTPSTYPPTKDAFPIWLHDPMLNEWYGLSKGLFRIGQASLPQHVEKGGELLGVYEIWYDTEASDVYDTSQLAYLVCLLMQSQYMPQDTPIVAMYGCMKYLNTAISSFLIGAPTPKLQTFSGTRFTDLSCTDQDWRPNVMLNLIGDVTNTFTFLGQSGEVVMQNISMQSSEHVIKAECVVDVLTARQLGNILSTYDKKDVFQSWNNALQESADDYELVEPSPACKAFYAQATHVFEQPYADNNDGLFLAVNSTYYRVGDEGEIEEALDMTEALANAMESCGSIFSYPLFCNPDYEYYMANDFMSKLFVNLTKYFLNFERLQALYKYFVSCDSKSGDWTHIERADALEEFVLVPLSNPEIRGVLVYNNATHLWSHESLVPNEFAPFDGIVGISMEEAFTCNTQVLQTMCNAIQPMLKSIRFDSSGIEYDRAFNVQRPTPSVEDSLWRVKFGDSYYTGMNGKWTRVTRATEEFHIEELDPEEFISLLLDWFKVFARFSDCVDAWAYCIEMLGADFRNIQQVPESNKKLVVIYTTKGSWMAPIEWDDAEGPDLHRRKQDTANKYGINIHIETERRYITLQDFALYCVQPIDKISTGIMQRCKVRNPNTPWSEEKAYFSSRVGKLVDVENRKFSSDTLHALVRDPILVLADAGDVEALGWDGDNWHLTHWDERLYTVVGRACGVNICVDSAMLYYQIPEEDACHEFYKVLNALWEPGEYDIRVINDLSRGG